MYSWSKNMSDTWLRLVPRNEEYIPSLEVQISAAKYYFREFCGCDDLEFLETEAFNLNRHDDEFGITVHEVLTFFDAGTNGSAFCPNCDEPIDIEFLMEWEEEDEDETLGYKFERRQLPCCNKAFTLRELKYDFDQGFGYFCLEALLNSTLSSEEIAEFQKILGCPLRVIYQRL
jgi:hypothetical protein